MRHDHRARLPSIPNEMENPAALALLPDDLLADILTRLAPRDLAMAMGVCKAWRAVIDAHRLLRVDLLPLSLGGIFINFNGQVFSEYFFEPSTTPAISSMSDYVPHSPRFWRQVVSHCNGLLLLSENYVVNPATRWWAQLPTPLRPKSKEVSYFNYLVFDPILSSHYEVFSVPYFGYHGSIEEYEWPPSSCTLQVFSSRTGGWEERLFVRDGEDAEIVSDMFLRSAVYYRRALYVRYYTPNIVLRISLLDGKYRAIKPPSDTQINEILSLGKSKDGVYLASVGSATLRIWVLVESCGQAEWLPKYRADLKWKLCEKLGSSWLLQDVNYYNEYNGLGIDKEEAEMEARAEIDQGPFLFLGFHPFEEVVFLSRSLRWGLAYHLTSSKIEYLGYQYPTGYNHFIAECEDITDAYPYTPCSM
ncbi:hypothetical protein PR202_ga12842 [Eleusine coracana subsp. coracana]|uniref:F-box domain-containing protein n=1 Tax=Eleusine coracana subsp. coracana TaxID=191504 RepID=A0AAV5CCP7_ELECO|nr:hypothetical protein PR202_ga12842 [Eleusine coracana subsp. coracana]